MTIKDPAELVIGETYKVRYYELHEEWRRRLRIAGANPADHYTVEQEIEAKFKGTTTTAFALADGTAYPNTPGGILPRLGAEGWANAPFGPFLEFENRLAISRWYGIPFSFAVRFFIEANLVEVQS